MKKNLDKSSPINIAIVGGGRRVSLFYIELCVHFQSIGLVNVVGISNRTLSKIRDFSKYLNCNLYETVEELIECEDVDAGFKNFNFIKNIKACKILIPSFIVNIL